LQPHEAPVQAGSQHLGDFGLAGPGLALQEQRPLHRQRQMHRGRQFMVGNVSLRRQQLSSLRDRSGQRDH
jgi:hypothetical protein